MISAGKYNIIEFNVTESVSQDDVISVIKYSIPNVNVVHLSHKKIFCEIKMPIDLYTLECIQDLIKPAKNEIEIEIDVSGVLEAVLNFERHKLPNLKLLSCQVRNKVVKYIFMVDNVENRMLTTFSHGSLFSKMFSEYN